ncbi:restriction endonuclease subunit S [Blautia sp. An46]|uniref:restriction endonuclease subunit S n=1 Tax=Blautia sp. An46 TaxID=1965636 RepID=UPI001FA8D802|nr:restriction endonuclease subunit S [Blautia sp. An46]
MNMRTIEECFYQIRNGVNIKQGTVDGGYPITRIETIANDKFNRDRMGYAGITDLEKYESYVLEDGDLLMSHINSIQYLGRTVLYKKHGKEKIIHGMNLLRLKARRDIIRPEYAKYYFYSRTFKEKIERITKKSVNQASFAVADLKKIKICVPDLSIQDRVIDILDRVNPVIEERQQELEKLDELIKARFIEMFGDPVSNPLGWKKKTLKEVCIKLNDGTHFSPESFDTGEYKYVTAKNIKISGFDFTNITYVPEEVHRPIYERCNPELGDVLYIKDGVTTGIAMVNTLEEEFTLLSSVALLKQDRRIMNGHFLAALLNNENMYTDIRSNMGGAAITRLTIAKLNTIKVILPPIELQEQFAAFVTQTDKSKVAIQKSLEKTQLLFDSLMQKYFG